jgi:hypothetical protein
MSSRGFLQKPVNIYHVEEEEIVIPPVSIEPEVKKSENVQEDWEKDFNSIFNIEVDTPKKPNEDTPKIVELVEETPPPLPTPEPIVETVEPTPIPTETPTPTPTPEPIVETLEPTPTPTPVVEEKKPLVEPIVPAPIPSVEPIVPITTEQPKEKILKHWGNPEGWNKSQNRPLFQRPENQTSKPQRKKRNGILKILYWGIRDLPMDSGDQYRYDTFMLNIKIGLIVGLTAFLLLLILFKTAGGYSSSSSVVEHNHNDDLFNQGMNWIVEKFFKK